MQWHKGPRKTVKGVAAATLVAAILGSSSIAFASTGSTTTTASTSKNCGLLGCLLGTVTNLVGGTVGALTGLLGLDVNLPLLGEFGNQSTATPVSRPDVRVAIDAAAATTTGLTGAGIDVALIDTGVAPVAGINSSGALVNGPDLSLDQQVGMAAGADAFGHGTHLAGIIAGRDGGIAPGARLLNMKVGAANGAVDVTQVIAAIDWVVAHRKDPGMNVRVLNLAYGTDSTQVYTSSPLTHAVESAWRAGIVVVVSAGNSGGALINPATDPFVITVGGIDVNTPANYLDDKLATYSSVGDNRRGVDVLAPGTSIKSLRVPGSMVDTTYPDSRADNNTQTKGSGTSQAAAVVSGAAALLLQSRPTLTPDQVKAVLKASARPLARVASNAEGSGVIDLGKALVTGVPTNATQTFTKSTGTGPIEAARGTAHLTADNGTQLKGEIDLLGAAWAPSTWAPLSTAGKAWTGGTWNGNVWAGADWEPTNTVDGVAWQARSWRSELWSARSWRADLWAARSWRDATWKARSWRGDSWG